MTKVWHVPRPVTRTPKSGSDDLGNALKKFPSPPKKDGTKNPERILAKRRREAEEAKAKAGSSSGRR